MRVVLGTYKGFQISKPEINVSDEEVLEAIEVLQDRYKIYEEKDGVVEKQDHLMINYDCYYDGARISEVSRQKHNFKIGEGLFHEKFENALYGKRKGDKFTIGMVMDQKFNLRYLRNEMVTFEVELLSISKRVVPELTDDTVKTFNQDGIDTVEKLKLEMKQKIQVDKMKDVSIIILNKIMKRIIDCSIVDLDHDTIDVLKQEILEDFKVDLRRNNASLDLYMKETGKTEAEIIELCEEEAKTYLTEKSILEEIGKQENIVLTDDESERFDDEERLRVYCEKVVAYLLKVNTVS